MQFKAFVSYLELYNEQGYDLLDESHDTKALEDLPKVKMLEDEHGNFHLKNLSLHPVASEEDALNLLFLGDTNRAIAETPMNLVRAEGAVVLGHACDICVSLSCPWRCLSVHVSSGLVSIPLHLHNRHGGARQLL